MNSAKLKETIANIVKEESEYQVFFRKALEKAGKSITDMSDEEKKEFFNKIDAAWDGKGEKNEGNAFGAAVVAAKKAGEDEFEVGGKTYKVEESVNEEVKDWDRIHNSFVKFLKANTKVLEKIVLSKDEDATKKAIKSIISGLTNAQRNLNLESVNEGKKRFNTNYGVGKSKYVVNYHDGVKKHKDGSDFFDVQIFKNQKDLEAFKKALLQKGFVAESVNEASYVSGYTVKAKTPYEFVNGAYAVLSAYLRDEELGPKGKRELQNILKSLEYMRKYFFFNLSESVNEIKKGSVVIPYAMDKHGEFIVDKVFKNKSGETSYTGKFKKSGEAREFILHSKDRVVKESVNEAASRTAMEIGGLTGLNKDAIQKFVDTHNMDIEKVYQYVKKSKLTDRLNFVTAIVGTPGNPVQKRMIKMFGESVLESKSVNEGRAFINAARKAKQEGKTEFEFNGKKYPVTLKEGTLNEMNPQLNKGVKSLLDKELKDLRKGGSNHLFAVMNVLMGALTDANFHSESKKVPTIFGSKAKYEGDPMAQKDMESLYQSIGERIATMAKWDGEDIAKAVGFYVSMTIGRPLGQKIENLV
jgi:hypothetical protein